MLILQRLIFFIIGQVENARVRNIAIVAWGDAKTIADGLVGLAKVRMLEYAENQEMGVVELLV